MRGYANQALKLSTRNTTGAGRVNRAVFRTLLRAGARFPARHRRMFRR